VALWLESMEPGKPLSFLDHHVKVGNSLLGATPALLEKGIPDEAFDAIEGDDKKLCTQFRKANKREREDAKQHQKSLFSQPLKLGNLTSVFQSLAALPDDSIEQVAAKQQQYESLVRSSDYLSGRLLADAWCAAFVWKKTADFDFPLTEEVFRAIEANPRSQPAWLIDEVRRLAEQYRFFHWHLEFPEVFGAAAPPPDSAGTPASMPAAAGWSGGFDCVLGNPVWERVKLQEQEFFSTRAPEIAGAKNAAARKKLIAALPESNPALWTEWCEASRESQGVSKFLRESGRFPLCGVGDINTYAVFSELSLRVLSEKGRSSLLVPPGIATDDTTKAFFSHLVDTSRLAALYHFENEEKLFQGVDHRFAFVMFSLGPSKAADLFFFARQTTALADKSRHFTLTPDDFALLNPNTRTCPTFRSLVDAELNKYIYRRTGVLWDERKPDGNPWDISFLRMFDMTNDSGLFRGRGEMEAAGQTLTGNVWSGPIGKFLPLIEAKMVTHFDHRFSTYEGVTQAQLNVGTLPRLDAAAHADPHCLSQPEWWLPEREVINRLNNKSARQWHLCWRDICRATDQRTVSPCVLPTSAVGNKLPLLMSTAKPVYLCSLYVALASFIVDYASRQKIGGASLNYFILRQLPIPLPGFFAARCPWSKGQTVAEWLLPRVLELTYTSWDLEPFARDCGYTGPPFGWDEERRFQLRCELDAAFFRLYLGSDEEWARDTPPALREKLPSPRHAIKHIMESFPIVKRKDEEAFGAYRTGEEVLSCFCERG